MSSAIAVFCGKSRERILREGGTQAWRLVPSHAAKQEFVVCCRSGVDWVEGSEERGSAFLIGKVSGIAKATDYPGRYLIKITEYADVSIPGVWQGWRNPVKYTTLEELGIDAAQLRFKQLEEATPSATPSETSSGASALSLSIAQAKPALARHYEVPVDAVEITIRG